MMFGRPNVPDGLVTYKSAWSLKALLPEPFITRTQYAPALP